MQWFPIQSCTIFRCENVQRTRIRIKSRSTQIIVMTHTQCQWRCICWWSGLVVARVNTSASTEPLVIWVTKQEVPMFESVIWSLVTVDKLASGGSICDSTTNHWYNRRCYSAVGWLEYDRTEKKNVLFGLSSSSLSRRCVFIVSDYSEVVAECAIIARHRRYSHI